MCYAYLKGLPKLVSSKKKCQSQKCFFHSKQKRFQLSTKTLSKIVILRMNGYRQVPLVYSLNSSPDCEEMYSILYGNTIISKWPLNYLVSVRYRNVLRGAMPVNLLYYSLKRGKLPKTISVISLFCEI